MMRAVLLFGFAAALASPAYALEIDAPPLSEAELAETRGGILMPNGVEANFGALARTFADGQLLLETQIIWDAQGIQTQQAISSDALTPSDQLAGGFVLQGADGATLFAHQIDADGVRNILVNDASGRDIRIDTQLQVTLPGFSITQQGMRDSLLALRLFDDLGAASN